MYIVDDPMLVLITRFVRHRKDTLLSDQAFMRQQVQAVQDYVGQFPQCEKNQRAIEWIGKYARQYRQSWQRGHISRQMQDLRCLDCPLADESTIPHCEIHQRWAKLLTDYAADHITSEEYVEKTLAILRTHKIQLKTPKKHQNQHSGN